MGFVGRKLFTLQSIAKRALPQIQPARFAGHWNDDWKPGPYPKTEAERLAAAKRYGLIPEDYEPYPDDGMGYGDYPKLPIVSAESRDPFECYDYKGHRRNWGEPLHVDADIYGLDRIKHAHTDPVSPIRMGVWFFTAYIGFFVLTYLGEDFFDKEMKPQQFPHRGETHYTFESAE
uniref:NADH dehydrogenase (Ubiquinone) 1 beta subcomplex subunit 8, mitochondrial-like n=1 Tax=Hirondellea gigas TaxID=1518452 RepID=A0A2P2HW85_9CRUS